jgi:predicted lactoylglutathione lyase
MPASRQLFLNLAVADLQRSVDFFTALGFTFDERFTDENATCMVVNDQAFVMLLVRDFFAGFAIRDVADPTAGTEAIVAFSVDSREEVDRLADAALAAGGTPAGDPMDHGFMVMRSFQDPDGHHWEVVWMDAAAVEDGPPAVETRA